MDERFTAIHATHLADHDFVLLGDAGSTVCLCPTTERDLADGVGPAARLAEAGTPLSLGSDSNAVIDLFEEARAVEMDERLVSGARGHHGPAALLRAATCSGQTAIGWPEAGRIEPGAIADLVTVGLDSVRLAGTEPADALASLVFAGGAADVRAVLCGGREIVRDGRHVSIDAGRELTSSIRALSR